MSPPGTPDAAATAAPPRAGVNRAVLVAGLAVVVPLILLLVLNIGRNPHAVSSPMLNKPAPDFALRPAGGGPAVSLASLRGKPVVLNFWATWCVPCFEEHGVLTEAARLHPGVHFVGVIYEDEEERVNGFLSRQGKAYPSLMDPEGKTAIAYGVYGVPETFFIDAGGQIVSKYVGPLRPDTLAGYLRLASRAK